MRRLVIDSATRACSVALFEDDKLLDSRFELIGRGHAERLVPMIASLPDKGRADRIYVDVGPGSFTGVRIGIATARALALVWDVDVVGYGSLVLTAAGADIEAGSRIAVVMNGGHGEYFVAEFDDMLREIVAPLSMAPERAAELCKAERVIGDRAEQFVGLRGFGVAQDACPNASNHAKIMHLAPLDCRPLYGREPDARVARHVGAP